jgi:hypothetical protein
LINFYPTTTRPDEFADELTFELNNEAEFL